MREAQLFGAWLCAREEIRAKLEGKSACEGPRDELGLIVAAFAKARRVKGYWDDDIRGKLIGIAGSKFGKSRRKPRSERCHAIVFYEENRADHRIVIVGKTAREAEGVRFGAAEPAKKLRRVSNLV